MQTILERAPAKIIAASLVATTFLSAQVDCNYITLDDRDKVEINQTYKIPTNIYEEKIFNSEYNTIQEELLSYADEVKNPSPTEMYFARMMLSSLSEQNIITPKIMLDNESEISFYWRSENKYIEISVNEEGLFSYLIDDKVKPIGGEDISIHELQKLSLFLDLKFMQSIKS